MARPWRALGSLGATFAATPAIGALVPPATLPSLRRAPLVEAMVLESPWLLASGMVLISLVVAAVLARRGRLMPALIVVFDAVLIPVVLYVASEVVVTSREQVKERSVALVQAVANADRGALATLLAEDATLRFMLAPDGWDKPRIVSWVDDSLTGEYAVSAHRIKEIQAETGPEATIARTRVTARVTPRATDRPQVFICLLTWRQEIVGSEPVWRVTRIEPLWLQGFGELQR